MSLPHRPPASKFEPEEWSRIYDGPQAAGRSFIFRRASELALEICRELILPGQRWVDLGCGTGHLMRACGDLGASMIGADHDAHMVEFARQRSADIPRSRNLHYLVAQVERLPFDNATLDGLIATSVMGCIASPQDFFAEAQRVLRDAGHAVMTFTNQSSGLLKLNSLPAHLIDLGRGMSKRRNIHLYRDTHVTENLEQLGFRVLRVDFYNFVLQAGNWSVPPSRFAKKLERFGRRRFSRWLARNFIVTAQKVPT
jgi:ubiquinone/menaquinone biosynthesis C-methylase UbiE